MSRPDEGLIHQWLDGECTPEESARIEHLVATDPAWAAAVAEARGLIAASARIVGALDAVPRAMPTQGTAPQGKAPQRAAFRVPRWLGVAAAFVLVAGTAYVLRDQSRAPFGPVVTPAPPRPAAMDTAPGVQVANAPRDVSPPPTMPPTVPSAAAERTADAAAGAGAASGSTLPAQSPSVAPTAPPVSPPVAAAAPLAAPADANAAKRAEADDAAARRVAQAEEQARARNAMVSRRAPLMADSPRGAVAPEAMAPSPTAPPPLPTLAGCWRVTAPPEQVGVLDAPPIRRAQGDTLVLVTLRGDVTVIREGETLRGALQATRVPCGATY